MSTSLFDEFTPSSEAAWKQKIQVDLKGADYNDSLLWKTDEGIEVKPFYTKKDRKETFIYSEKSTSNICQSLFVDNEKIANKIALNAIENGATAIEFVATKPFDYKILLQDIDNTIVQLHFRLHFLDENFTQILSKETTPTNSFFHIDIYGNLARSGNWHVSLESDHLKLKKIATTNTNCIGIDARIYQNSGANIVQQLAYALAQANEYLHYYGAEAAKKMHFSFAVGGNYFFEIAKLKAFKILWKALLNDYKVPETNPSIFTQPSLRNKTIYDYNTNMLRTTTECMSAILGGATTISNTSYDTLFHKKNNFGERIARNQLLILQEESYLNKANTISNGSYYIESITHQLAEKALQIFKAIEKGGGFLKQLKLGNIQRKIQESALKEQDKFDRKELVLIGSNKFSNEEDLMKNDLELYPFVKQNPTKTLLVPILTKRLSEAYEKERLKTESK